MLDTGAQCFMWEYVRCTCSIFLALATVGPSAAQAPATRNETLRDFVDKYCVACHSAKKARGSLDLETLARADAVGKVKVWKKVWDRVKAQQMPPPASFQPGHEERTQ